MPLRSDVIEVGPARERSIPSHQQLPTGSPFELSPPAQRGRKLNKCLQYSTPNHWKEKRINMRRKIQKKQQTLWAIKDAIEKILLTTTFH